MPNDADDVLTIQAGSQKSFEVFLVDDRDLPEDLTGATAARLRIAADVTDAAGTAVLDRSTSASNLAISIADSKIVASFPIAADADIAPARYVGQASFQIGGAWFHTDWFYVDVLPQIAPTS